MNLTSDREILDYLMMRAKTSGIPVCQITIWAHMERAGNEWLCFRVKSNGEHQVIDGESNVSIDEAFNRIRPQVKSPTIAQRDKARELRKQAEELLSQADKLSDEPTLPPSPEMLAQLQPDRR